MSPTKSSRPTTAKRNNDPIQHVPTRPTTAPPSSSPHASGAPTFSQTTPAPNANPASAGLSGSFGGSFNSKSSSSNRDRERHTGMAGPGDRVLMGLRPSSGGAGPNSSNPFSSNNPYATFDMKKRTPKKRLKKLKASPLSATGPHPRQNRHNSSRVVGNSHDARTTVPQSSHPFSFGIVGRNKYLGNGPFSL